MKGVKIKTECAAVYILCCCQKQQWPTVLTFTRSLFDNESTDSLFKDIFTWHTAPERQTGFYICRNLQQQRLLTVVPPQGQTSTLRPLSTILFGLVHSHVLQQEKQGHQKEVRLCKKKRNKIFNIYKCTAECACVLFHTGTEYVSSIWNSAGSSLLKLVLEERRLRNIFSRSMFSPVTFEIWKMGHILGGGGGGGGWGGGKACI